MSNSGNPPPSELPAEGSGQPYFPPPPPGPPPAQQQSQHQEQQHRPQEKQQGQSHEQLPDAYSIPIYNPANPVFAPPPTSDAAVNSEQQGYLDMKHHDNTLHSQTQAVPANTHAAAHGQKKSGWSERFSALGAKVAAPINSVAHKLGSQSFLPETLDKECDKAAVILKAFCKKGVYADPGAGQPPTSTDPKATESTGTVIDPTKEKPKARVLVTIPPKVISKSLGLAIFTTLRAGFQFSGATGSGILIARLPDGSWSPPSAIQVHSVGAGFQIGLDIFDCVCVINSKEALAAFMKTRVSLGSDLTVVAGPYGAGGAVDVGTGIDRTKDDTSAPGVSSGVAAQASPQTLQPGQPDKKSHRRSLSASGLSPVFSYVKSRGFYAGVQVDGTVVVERKEANNAFYGAAIAVDHILKGQVPPQGPLGMWPTGSRTLHEALAGAEAGAFAEEKTAAHHPAANIPIASATTNDGAPPSYADPTGTGKPFDNDVKYR